VNGLICIMGIVFLITVFVASVFFGLSWHSCPNGEVDCVNYSDEGISAEVLAVMLIIPIVIISVVSCGECMRLRK
jgi:energy-converting hydrogenase Eha subunit F